MTKNWIGEIAEGMVDERERLEEKSNDYLDKFVRSQGRARLSFKKWKDNQLDLESVESDAKNEEELKEYVESLIEEDKKALEEIEHYVREFEDATGHDFKDKIFSMFEKIFVDIRSRSYEVANPETESYTITVGPYGFGIRWNTQAKQLQGFRDLVKLYRNRDLIVAGIKRELGLNDSKRWANMFDKFCEIVPDLEDLEGQSISVELKKPILIPHDLTAYKRYEPPRMCEKIEFGRSNGFSLVWNGEFSEIGSSYDRKTSFSVDLSRDAYEHLRGCYSLLYLQIHSRIPMLKEEVKMKAVPYIEKAKTTIEKLQQEFGRYLLIQDL